MMNLGPRPTFGEIETTLEAHLFGATQEIYGTRVRLDFISFLRDTRKFASVDELVQQLERDRENALRALTPFGVSGNLKGYSGTGTFTPSVA
jgi:riboflavin kinase/FMN adenylyltransferase